MAKVTNSASGELTVRSEHACFGGTQGFYRHVSRECGGPMDFAVFVPSGGEHRPVVYFLSGLTCTPENFTVKAGAQRIAAELGLILVVPDTSPRNTGIPGEDGASDLGAGAGFYVDATRPPWSAHYRMYSYVRDELPALVEACFPARDRRSVFGHSMGGHGALVLGLREPGRYRSISALAPICAPSHAPWGQRAFMNYLGEDRATWALYDASELARSRRHPAPIRVDVGLADPFLSTQLAPERLEAVCLASGQALELHLHEGYDHGYFFVATFVEAHLRHHARWLA